MLNYLYRLRAKKAFTMVELLVVIAIIGILLAMILPNLFNSDKPTKAKAYAKSYFYAVQDFMSRQRIADDPDNPVFDPAISRFCYYTTVDDTGNAVESGIISYITYTATDSVTYQGSGASAGLKKLMSKFAQEMENNITTTEYAGTFYVVVDSEYRVQIAYWADGDMDELRAGSPTLSFSDNNQLGGYVCAAYPTRYSHLEGTTSGRTMFDFT